MVGETVSLPLLFLQTNSSSNETVAVIFDGTAWIKYGSSTTDYEALLNKPSINGVTLEKNKTFEELGREDIANARIKQIIDEQFNLIFGGGN